MRTPEGPVTVSRTVWHFSEEGFLRTADEVATEYALTIHVNDRELATVVCTPEYLEELVAGFLASEGVVRHAEQIADLQVIPGLGVARVRTATPVNINQEFYNKRYVASCCGKGRQSFYFFNDAQTARRVEDPVSLTPDGVFACIAALEERADVFHRTGGVHMACLCRPDGSVSARPDIGRHNALDKLLGHVLLQGLSPAGCVIAFSGRLSSEVVLKVAKIGCAIVVARSAPTALAIDLADELNLTAIGFARGSAFNVYTHPWRMTTGPVAG